MISKFYSFLISYLLIVTVLLAFLFVSQSYAEPTIELEWVEITEPNVVGYRVFSRIEDEIYDYDSPIWEGPDTSCLVDIPEDGAAYFFVVRVLDEEGYECIDSNEVSYQCPIEHDRDTGNDTGNHDDGNGNLFSESGCFIECLSADP